jgi:transcription-repair coupling factor (superfamily II helicase)
LRFIIDSFNESEELKSITSGLYNNLNEQLITGISGSARSIFISSVNEITKKTILVVTNNLLSANKIYEELSDILSEEKVWLYPADELISAEISISSPELRAQRIEVLNKIINGEANVIIAPISGTKRLLPPKNLWVDSQLEFQVGNEFDITNGATVLSNLGYERSEIVSKPGEFSIRGGLLDIYPITESNPIRIEFFDTEIDSIRFFSSEDQRSINSIDKITISPNKEIILTSENIKEATNRLKASLKNSLAVIKDEKTRQLLLENIEYDIEKLENGLNLENQYKYISLYYDTRNSLIDYLPEGSLIVFDEVARVVDTSLKLEREEAEFISSLLEYGKAVHNLEFSIKTSDIIAKKINPKIYMSTFLSHVAHTSPQNIVNITSRTMQDFHGQLHLLKNELNRWKKSKYSVFVLANSEERKDKIKNTFDDYDIPSKIIYDKTEISKEFLNIVHGNLQKGFELPATKTAVIAEGELFKLKREKPKASRQKLTNAEKIQSYSELKIGDYVVHINHGIGKYLGIVTLEISGVHKDYLHLSYKGNDTLYVPVEQINQVQKYVPSEGKEPKVYKLGGSEWKKVKAKVERSVKDIADDLIKLYSARQESKGFAFSYDSVEQREFESLFPYQETDDQLRAVIEIKSDMESERPMDRLLCGDVGYGKTEVALRAAFKAIIDGKQVAILVPTTILAQQHYQTILERFSDFPINIGLLNRFVSKKNINDTLDGLKVGSIDIVVGTHRLLSKDVRFKDLGLLIVDEEQRFGVTHKEKIKQLKTNIDVLTLSATPIPRTLHMSMLGVRDLSVLETPPENRYPVQTYVLEANNEFVKEAIERELAREGQVFYLHNFVEDIDLKAEEISTLVPDARVAFAHGQMKENELESIILGFLDKQYDVLVSTTIIETGIDIPNANTLIVNNADRMGLSQLYQLRGRVGRSNRVAYAYFTYKKDKVLNEVSEKRLQAIKEFTELGSGFKIAMRDLSIRGTGNLLGAQQHGFIDSVGFDLFSQMLKDAIDDQKGVEPSKNRRTLEIDMEIDAYLPDSYISDSRQKIDMYKKIQAITELEELYEVQEEMVDRFGDFPKQVADLLQIAEIKVYAYNAGVISIKQKNNQITVEINKDFISNVDVGNFYSQGVKDFGSNFNVGYKEKNLVINLFTKKIPQEKWLDSTKIIIQAIIENLRISTENAKI